MALFIMQEGRFKVMATSVDPQRVEQLRKDFGLDDTQSESFFSLNGDWGHSFTWLSVGTLLLLIIGIIIFYFFLRKKRSISKK